MKYEVTEPGVYDAMGQRVSVGTEVEAKGDKVPGYLANKSRVVSGRKVAVTNPARGALPGSAAARQARLKEIVGGLSEDDFTASGAPDVNKVNELLNEGEQPFTAAERDHLWPGIKPAA